MEDVEAEDDDEPLFERNWSVWSDVGESSAAHDHKDCSIRRRTVLVADGSSEFAPFRSFTEANWLRCVGNQ
jgi:hypothetical protein